MPRIKTVKKPAAKKADAGNTATAACLGVAALSNRIDALVATLTKMLNADVEPGE